METKWGIDKINKPKTPDGRNVIDHFYFWKQEDIKAELNKNRLPFAVLVSNLGNDFNIGTCLRNCNIFGAKEFFYYGRKKFDKRGCVSAQFYEQITHIPEESDLDKISKEYTWVGVDMVPGAVPIDTFEYPEKPLFIIGQEHFGIPEVLLERCKNVIYIKQQGSIPSLNCGVASGIVMYDYASKYQRLQNVLQV